MPPSLPAEILRQTHNTLVDIADNLLTAKSHYKLLIAGDTNSFKCSNLCTDLFLEDIVTSPTRKESCLDHILASKELSQIYKVYRVVYEAPIGSSDHLVITCNPSNPCGTSVHVRWHKVFDFRESVMCQLMLAASKVDWKQFVEGDDVNEMWNRLCAVILETDRASHSNQKCANHQSR